MDYRKRCLSHWPKPFKDKKTGEERPTDAGFLRDEGSCAECFVELYCAQQPEE